MKQETSGLAIASLVLSCLSVFLGPFGCAPGIICGHVALSRVSRDGNLGGRGLAVSGLVIGYVFLVLIIVIVAMWAGRSSR
jgi:hypothetical protein